MNVLITSASSKLRLIDAFQKAVQDAGGRVIAVDSNPNCTAATFADHFHSLPCDEDAGYEQAIFRLCEDNKIGLIIPTRDGELMKLASMQKELTKRGVYLPLPEPKILDVVLDKVRFYEFCLEHDFPVYQHQTPSQDAVWPLFMRFRQSAAGEGAVPLKDHQAWLESGASLDEVICQQISHDKEYSIDVLMSFKGEAIHAVARERCLVEGGESVEGIIANKPELCKAAKDLCSSLGLKGHNLVQAFCSEDNDIHFIEVNARYGGGSMMSVEAGMNTPAWLLLLVEADDDNLQKTIKNISMSKINYGMKLTIDRNDPVNYVWSLK